MDDCLQYKKAKSMINKLKDIAYNILFKEKVYINSDDSLKGKVVIITGASKGIGKATAEVLLKKGASVSLVARDTLKLKKDNPQNFNSLIISADVTKEEDCKKIAYLTIQKFGKIDALINCAGIFTGGNLENFSGKQFDSIVNTNIKGVFLMSCAVIPFMKKVKRGFIINMGSKISHNTNVKPGKVLYATTKYAVEGFSFALNKELKPFGIRVSCLMPGLVKTFRSPLAHEFLSPFRVGELISVLLKHEDIHFEGLIFQSRKGEL